MKEITIQVPDGTRAEWNKDGLLQLVKNEPKKENKPFDFHDIKTFEDAVKRLTETTKNSAGHPLVIQYNAVDTALGNEPDVDEEDDRDILAYLKLRIITAAINDGWEPQFTEDECRWYPWFYLWTEDELKDKSDEWKDKHQLLLWGGHANDGTSAGLGYADSPHAFSHTNALYGSRLAYKTEAAADYSGHQFAELWCIFNTGKEGTPWRNI